MRTIIRPVLAALFVSAFVAGCRPSPVPHRAAQDAAGETCSVPPPLPAQEDSARKVNPLGMSLVAIAPGEFVMGNRPGGNATERDHPVRLTRPYLIGSTEVTQAQWSAVMPDNPSRVRRGGCVGFYASAAASGARDCGPPDRSWDDVGFRVVADAPR